VSSTGVSYFNNLKEEITTHLSSDCPKLDFFGDEPFKDTHHELLKIGAFQTQSCVEQVRSNLAMNKL
jgi:hypothetical protein